MPWMVNRVSHTQQRECFKELWRGWGVGSLGTKDRRWVLCLPGLSTPQRQSRKEGPEKPLKWTDSGKVRTPCLTQLGQPKCPKGDTGLFAHQRSRCLRQDDLSKFIPTARKKLTLRNRVYNGVPVVYIFSFKIIFNYLLMFNIIIYTLRKGTANWLCQNKLLWSSTYTIKRKQQSWVNLFKLLRII